MQRLNLYLNPGTFYTTTFQWDVDGGIDLRTWDAVMVIKKSIDSVEPLLELDTLSGITLGEYGWIMVDFLVPSDIEIAQGVWSISLIDANLKKQPPLIGGWCYINKAVS